MKISKSDWHYKLFYFHHWRMISSEERIFKKTVKVPEKLDFCSYFHKAIIRNSIYGLSLIIFLMILGIVIFNTLVLNFIPLAVGFFYAVTLTAIVLGVIFGVMYLFDRVKKKLNKTKTSEVTENKVNIFGEKYRSWKEKHCPIVEIKE